MRLMRRYGLRLLAASVFLLGWPSSVGAVESAPALGAALPVWTVAPFALLLLCIAVLPLLWPRFWARHRNKALVSAALGVPVAVWIAFVDQSALMSAAHEYAAFIILLASLFIISGGVVVRGTLSGTPGVNTILLAIGALLASFVGTTGASLLLVRPLLRANSVRRRKAHVVVFFIFLVSNIGGLLTPLGDPPLFLGFLRGVPFTWTLGLWREWLASVGILLMLFYVVDSTIFRKEDLETPGDLDRIAVEHEVPISVAGKRNLVYLAGIVAVIYVSGTRRPPIGVQEAAMALIAMLSLATTPGKLRQENGFAWDPIVEVTVIFAGIFATMIPALAILNARGSHLMLRKPWHFFWATGTLSSFLDNAPSYLTFASAASGIMGTSAQRLSELLVTAHGNRLLTAVAIGAVFMGANTYIGNGPNFMVKAVAESAEVRMPSFFGYMAYSTAILLPLFVGLTFAFFV
jgi:Na+/H+ antiporter NhaD/arsenite permease-like protein